MIQFHRARANKNNCFIIKNQILHVVSQRPRVTYEKLLHECQRHECNNGVILRVPHDTWWVKPA